MKPRYCIALFSLVLGAAGAQAQVRSDTSTDSYGVANDNGSVAGYTARSGFGGTDLLIDEAIDAALDDLNLLDPNLDPDDVLDLLADLTGDASLAAPKGGPAAVGYLKHPKWGSQGWGTDAIADTTGTGFYRAQAAVRLGNGDVVVAGTTRRDVAGARSHMGVVKYNSRGQRVRWTGVNADFGFHNNEYIRFPNNEAWGNTRQFIAVNDVKIHDNRIYVLFTFVEGGTRRAGVIRWGDTGAALGWWPISPSDGAIRDGVAIDVYGNQMIVLGRRSLDINDSNGGYWINRATIAGNGDVTWAPSPTTLFNGSRIIPTDIRIQRIGLGSIPFGPQKFYVTDSYKPSASANIRPCITRWNADNSLDNSFNALCNPFGSGGAARPDKHDWAVGLYNHGYSTIGGVIGEVLYMTTTYQANADRIGVVKLVNGAPDTTFGNVFGGKVYGGCESTPQFQCTLFATSHIALRGALYADSSGVYVAGRTYTPPLPGGGPPTRRPILVHINPTNGAEVSLQVFDGHPNSRFYSLVPGKAGAGGRQELTAVGVAHYADSTDINPDAPHQYLSTHLVRDNDLILYSGLQHPPTCQQGESC